MIVARGLLNVLWRQALPATGLGGVGLGLYALMWPDVMTSHDHVPALVILVYGLLLGRLLGRYQTPAFAFLHSRGYSRGVLWSHLMLASGLSVMAAWLPATLILWTGLRSAIFDRVLRSPYFPIMAPREIVVPLVWLAFFILLVPAVHYAWVRSAQPTKGGHNGPFVPFAILAALAVAFSMVYHLRGWFAWLCGALYAVTVVALILGGWRLYRSLEVRA